MIGPMQRSLHQLNLRSAVPLQCNQSNIHLVARGPSSSSRCRRIHRNLRHQRLLAAQAEPTSSDAGPPDVDQRRGGRSTYRPDSYMELVTDAVRSIDAALEDGLIRMEVDFPAVANVDGYKGSSDLYIDANVQLALAAAKQLYASSGRRVHILMPDLTEYRRAAKLFKSALELAEGVTFGHLLEGRPGLLGGFVGLFGSGGPVVEGVVDPSAAAAAADLFIALNASTIELADFEIYVNEKVGPSRAVVAWNMELDTLRSDLGLLGFPAKDLQHRFLSFFKPVFYIRQRDYSKTVAVAPFIINYSGALFREYPGPWQVMLRQDNGVYACVAEDASRRYGLGEFKSELTRAMGLEEAEGSTIAFLRTGYRSSTWWEDDVDKEQSNGWRT